MAYIGESFEISRTGAPRIAPVWAMIAGGTVSALLVAFGASLMIVAGLGATPVDVLITGVAKTFGLEVGTASWCVSIILVSIVFLFRKKPSFTSLVFVASLGFFINEFISHLFTPEHLFACWLMAFSGIPIFAAGIAILISVSNGGSPLELITAGISEYTHGSFVRTRQMIEMALFLIGVMLGGQFGWVTGIFAILFAPTLHMVQKLEPQRFRQGL